MGPFWDGWRRWRHVIKIDPDRPLTPARLDEVCASETDAVIVGGTQGMSAAKVVAATRALAGAPFPVVVEVSTPECLILSAQAFLIPIVLNATDPRWIVGAHQQALAAYLRATAGWAGGGAQGRAADVIPWHLLCPEAYIIQNPASAVGRLTGVREATGAGDALAYARLAEGLLSLPIVYLEYSGAYGDEELVRAVAGGLVTARLFYGGGIDGPERAARMAALADTVVIGNLVYSGGGADLAETVAAVRGAVPGRGGN